MHQEIRTFWEKRGCKLKLEKSPTYGDFIKCVGGEMNGNLLWSVVNWFGLDEYQYWYWFEGIENQNKEAPHKYWHSERDMLGYVRMMAFW